MRTLPLSLTLSVGLGLIAAPPPHVPDLKTWRLDVRPELGGWISGTKVDLSLKLVDPKDPEPPKEDRFYYSDGDLEEGDEGDGGDGSGDLEPAAARAQAEARRLAREEERARNAWRSRNLRVWFNGSERRLSVRVGYRAEDTLACQDGENRLEILEPDSGLRAIRTWWVSAGKTRLQIAQVRNTEEYTGGSLEVMEPNGALAGSMRKTPSGGVAGWNQFTHATPPAGTYTLRWTGIYRESRPCTVVVEAVLDGGTERERRWRFSKLILPGTGSSVLGTLDVED